MRVTQYTTLLNQETGAPFICKEKAWNYAGAEQIRSPLEIAHMMRDLFRAESQSEEYLWMLAFNNRMRLLGVFEISRGTKTSTIVDPGVIYTKACLLGASRIILVHNHPGGDCLPSAEDKNSTQRVRQAGELLCIPLSDHIIIGNGIYYSFHENHEI